MKRKVAGFLAVVLLVSQAGAEPGLEGRVRLASGEAAAGARVLLFGLADLRLPPASATTDASGRFTLPGALSSSSARALPRRIHLGPNYPNPFNPATIIPYELPTPAHVRLEVFNLLGQRIATLMDGPQPAGYHTARWHGTDAAGRPVAAGVYLYRMRGEGVSLTGRMVLVDGQAGVAVGAASGASEASPLAPPPAHGLVVSGAGLTPYVDPAFQVAAEGAMVDIVVQASRGSPAAKRASSAAERLLGDVDNNGRVDVADALLVALYSVDPSTVMPNGGDIALGDVNADGQVDITDAWLLMIHSVDPSHPLLPADIGSPVAPEPPSVGSKIYWADWTTDRIQRSNRDGSNVEDVVTGLVTPSGVAVDGSGGKLYWTDAGTDRIQRSNLDGSRIEDLVTTGLEAPRGLVIDHVAGKLYWADSGTDKIQRCNLDGSRVEDLVTTGLVTPTALALDPAGGKLYWTDAGTDRIQRSNLDGSRIEDLVTAGLVTPTGLAVDPVGGKLYWTDYGTDRIQRSNLDGSEVEDLITKGLVTPRGLVVDVREGKLYWTDSGRDRIQRGNLDGTGVEVLVSTGLATPVALALHDGTPVVDTGRPPGRPSHQLWGLPEGAVARLGKGLIGSGETVAYSPDGEWLAVASSIGVWLYDARTGAEARLLGADRALDVTFSPDGSTLAARVGYPYTVQVWLWDLATGRHKATLETGKALAFSPSGAALAVASRGDPSDTVRVWDLASGRPTVTLAPELRVGSLAFSPDGTTLALGGSGPSGTELRTVKTLQLWDVSSGQLKANLDQTETVRSVAFSPDGSILAAGCEDSSVRLWDVANGRRRARLVEQRRDWETKERPVEGPTDEEDTRILVHSVAFSPDGATLVSGSSYAVALWDVASGQRRALLTNTTAVYSVAYSPDGATVAGAGGDDWVRQWDVASGEVRTILDHGDPVDAVAFSPDGATVTGAGRRDRTIRAWEVASGRLKFTTLEGKEMWEYGMEPWWLYLSPDGSILATINYEGVQLWDAASGQLRTALRRRNYTVRTVAFSQGNSTLALAGYLNLRSVGVTLELWEVASGDMRSLNDASRYVRAVAFSPDGATLASGEEGSRTVQLWDVASGQLRSTLEGHRYFTSALAFSPDGTTLASGGGYGGFQPEETLVLLWDLASGQVKATLEGHTRTVQGLAFSPDGTTLASVGDRLRLWDVASGHLKGTLKEYGPMAFSPDGAIMATASRGTIMLWDMKPYLSGATGAP
ncbi:MAG: T9SS type A sorting domain-containing protein [Gemmatimonadaceae bacterium]|nr:T9SS type A sorting domain-containing protein [Gemmatimonadaceae bacterium]